MDRMEQLKAVLSLCLILAWRSASEALWGIR